MADLTLRVATALPPTGSLYTTKNAALTFSEIDNNFIEIDSEVHNVIDSLPVLSATPPVAVDGKIWYDTINAQTYIFNAATSTWEGIGGGSSYVTNTAPTSPNTGDLWYDLSTNQLKVYDGATSTWLNASGVTIIDGLNDVVSAGALASQLLEWDPTATDTNGNVGQWVATHTLDASPVGGTTDDF